MSAELKSGDMVASRAKVSNDFGFPRRVAAGLLHDKPFCAGPDAKPEHISPKADAGSFSVDCCCDTCLLARGASEANVGGNGRHGSNIFIDSNSGMKAGQFLAATLIAFAQGGDLEWPGPLQSDAVKADAGEKIEDAQFHPSTPF